MSPHPDITGPDATRRSDAFDFGRNWQRYIENYFDSERVEIAGRSLADLIGEDLLGRCSSTSEQEVASSRCARIWQTPRKVISVDVDPGLRRSVSQALEVYRQP